MTEKEYRAHPAISRSQLYWIKESPEKLKYYMDNPPEPTPALIFGQVLHKLVLQPESFEDEFAVMPCFDRRTKAGKEAFAEFEASCGDKTVINADTYEKAVEMTKKLYDDSFTRQLLSGEREKPFFWIDAITGEQCKCRVDCITEINGKTHIVDIKTTLHADNRRFEKESEKFGYRYQAAMYSTGVKECTGKECEFVFAAIEKDPPYSINTFIVDEPSMTYGYDKFREYIGTYHYCKVTGNWYGYRGRDNEVNILSLPEWLKKEVE